MYQFAGKASGNEDIVTLTREDAQNAHKVTVGTTSYILVTKNVMFQKCEGGKTVLNFQSDGDVEFKIFPALKNIPEGFNLKGEENGFAVYERTGAKKSAPEVSFEKISDNEKTASYKINVESWNNLDDVFI